ncbi:MAG: hypothetical protein FWG02_05685 [Holophagaceae bacterium]|nr:hypothetical protein [Holophagaceae bacterium]
MEVMPTELLRENLHKYIKTPTVRISQTDDEITLTPQKDPLPHIEWGTELCGILSSPINMADELVRLRNTEWKPTL